MRRYDYRFAGIYLLADLVKYIFADKRQRSIYRHVPQYCQICELMAICRDENNKWKCRHGCMTMSKKTRKAKKPYLKVTDISTSVLLRATYKHRV